jgi:hypothetical protein
MFDLNYCLFAKAANTHTNGMSHRGERETIW